MRALVLLAAAAATCEAFAGLGGLGFSAPEPTAGGPTRAACRAWPGPGPLCASSAGGHDAGGSSDGMVPPTRHPIYWIDECEPHNKTRETAARSARNLPTFLANKGVAPFNVEAFQEASAAYADYCNKQGKRPGEVPVVLDSCCGTGRSTWNMAKLRPDAFIVGVDKSLVRLTRNAAFRDRQGVEGEDKQTDDGWEEAGDDGIDSEADADSADARSRPPPRENMILVRANCIDFWRLVWESDLPVESHFILYPNPYPKPKQFALRWHGSPCFPILLYMGASIEVRASWRTYLEEMALAVDEIVGTGRLQVEELRPGYNMGRPLSNFETKYVKAEQPIYRLAIPALPRISAASLAELVAPPPSTP